MDLLGSIFAYLGSVVALIAAFAISYDVVIYAPLHSSGPPHTLTIAARPHPVRAASGVVHVARTRVAMAGRDDAEKTPDHGSSPLQDRAVTRRPELVRRQHKHSPIRQARMPERSYRHLSRGEAPLRIIPPQSWSRWAGAPSNDEQRFPVSTPTRMF